jgi:hypothetical protein
MPPWLRLQEGWKKWHDAKRALVGRTTANKSVLGYNTIYNQLLEGDVFAAIRYCVNTNAAKAMEGKGVFDAVGLWLYEKVTEDGGVAATWTIRCYGYILTQPIFEAKQNGKLSLVLSMFLHRSLEVETTKLPVRDMRRRTLERREPLGFSYMLYENWAGKTAASIVREYGLVSNLDDERDMNACLLNYNNPEPELCSFLTMYIDIAAHIIFQQQNPAQMTSRQFAEFSRTYIAPFLSTVDFTNGRIRWIEGKARTLYIQWVFRSVYPEPLAHKRARVEHAAAQSHKDKKQKTAAENDETKRPDDEETKADSLFYILASVPLLFERSKFMYIWPLEEDVREQARRAGVPVTQGYVEECMDAFKKSDVQLITENFVVPVKHPKSLSSSGLQSSIPLRNSTNSAPVRQSNSNRINGPRALIDAANFLDRVSFDNSTDSMLVDSASMPAPSTYTKASTSLLSERIETVYMNTIDKIRIDAQKQRAKLTSLNVDFDFVLFSQTTRNLQQTSQKMALAKSTDSDYSSPSSPDSAGSASLNPQDALVPSCIVDYTLRVKDVPAAATAIVKEWSSAAKSLMAKSKRIKKTTESSGDKMILALYSRARTPKAKFVEPTRSLLCAVDGDKPKSFEKWCATKEGCLPFDWLRLKQIAIPSLPVHLFMVIGVQELAGESHNTDEGIEEDVVPQATETEANDADVAEKPPPAQFLNTMKTVTDSMIGIREVLKAFTQKRSEDVWVAAHTMDDVSLINQELEIVLSVGGKRERRVLVHSPDVIFSSFTAAEAFMTDINDDEYLFKLGISIERLYLKEEGPKKNGVAGQTTCGHIPVSSERYLQPPPSAIQEFAQRCSKNIAHPISLVGASPTGDSSSNPPTFTELRSNNRQQKKVLPADPYPEDYSEFVTPNLDEAVAKVLERSGYSYPEMPVPKLFFLAPYSLMRECNNLYPFIGGLRVVWHAVDFLDEEEGGGEVGPRAVITYTEFHEIAAYLQAATTLRTRRALLGKDTGKPMAFDVLTKRTIAAKSAKKTTTPKRSKDVNTKTQEELAFTAISASINHVNEMAKNMAKGDSSYEGDTPCSARTDRCAVLYRALQAKSLEGADLFSGLGFYNAAAKKPTTINKPVRCAEYSAEEREVIECVLKARIRHYAGVLFEGEAITISGGTLRCGKGGRWSIELYGARMGIWIAHNGGFGGRQLGGLAHAARFQTDATDLNAMNWIVAYIIQTFAPLKIAAEEMEDCEEKADILGTFAWAEWKQKNTPFDKTPEGILKYFDRKLTEGRLNSKESRERAQTELTQKAIKDYNTIVNEYAVSKPIQTSIVDAYIKGRGLDPTRFHDSPDVRYMFNSRLPTKDRIDPVSAMMLVVRDNTTDKICGRQLTFLTRTTGMRIRRPDRDDPSKFGGTWRDNKGQLQDGYLCVQVGTESDFEKRICMIAEGFETAASVALARPDAWVYCTFGSAGLRKFMKPIEEAKAADKKIAAKALVVCGDNDGPESGARAATMKAMRELAIVWAPFGATLHLSIPEPPLSMIHSEEADGWDFNDMLKSQGVKAVKDAIERALGSKFDGSKQ